jgi:dihydrofolate reductase
VTLSLVAAVAANGVIGAGGRLPWRLPDDLRRFRALTLGHAVIMGHATFASLGRPLDGRRCIVLSRRRDLRIPGCLVAHSIEEALEAARGEAKAFVIGGAEVYAAFLPRAERLLLTWVDADVPGDVRFPSVDWSQWKVTRETSGAPDPRFPHRFVEYERIA